MSKKTKFSHVWGKAVDKDGNVHYVTIVGKLEQSHERVTVKEDAYVAYSEFKGVMGTLTYAPKLLKRKLTLGMSICHPNDEFNEEIGVKMAKSKIKKGQTLGSLETNNVTMLTDDAILAELFVKLAHITSNIDNYLP